VTDLYGAIHSLRDLRTYSHNCRGLGASDNDGDN
jgi:hypothetical protein